MKEKQYKDYNLNEKIIYAKGYNQAIRDAVNMFKDKRTIDRLLMLDKSVPVTDD